MAIDEEHLSAFLDGELGPEETRAVERALAADPTLQAELERLMAADALARREFDAMTQEAVPFALAAAIRAAPEGPTAANAPAPVRRSGRGWLAAAAVAGALALGGGAGWLLGQDAARTELAATAPGWLDAIADYHAVYARQVRHLVEVPAEEAEHIAAWLSDTLGATVTVPDLADQGLTFEGARLLVAAGRPVAQLIYTDAGGRVVALCQIASDAPLEGFGARRIGGFDMVTWGGAGANFVVVTDAGSADLDAIAQAAADRV